MFVYLHLQNGSVVYEIAGNLNIEHLFAQNTKIDIR